MKGMEVDWDWYPHFTEAEFVCHETGECKMQSAFMGALQKIREIYGRPMIIASGYRSLDHSVEKGRMHAGEHTLGLAADIKVSGADALAIIHIAMDRGVKRIGVAQKGQYSSRYIHLGIGDRFGLFAPSIWSY